jgi:Predicted signal transduction protein with a C-terminal ATPase domain
MSLVTTTYINNATKDINDAVDKIDRMAEVFQMYTQGSYSIIDDIKKYRKKGGYTEYDLYQTRNNMKFICQDLIFQNDFVNGIFIFTPSGENIGYGYGSDIDISLGYEPFHDQWYKNTLKLQGKIFISDYTKKSFIINSQPSISFSRAIYDVTTKEFLGVLLIDCSPQVFRTTNTEKLTDTISIFVEKDDGKILYSNQNAKKIPDLKALKTENANIEVQTRHSDWLPIKTVAYVNYSKLYNQFGLTRNMIIIISLLCIIAFIILSIVFSISLTSPILYLKNIMSKHHPHPLVTEEKYLNSNDEIGVLFNEYNSMIEEINVYIKENYQNKLIILDSQMRALEAQINPHFLYNTLETMNSIAEIEGVESISVMSLALGNMFRYSIKTKGELVSVEEELNHVKDYLSIERIRYGEMLNYNFVIDKNILKLRILKLILQPVVENAIKHGYTNTVSSANIIISGLIEGNLIRLKVADNGIGMSIDKIAEINELLAKPPKFSELGQRSKESVGLKNIHSRIQLYYGTEYGLSVQSNEGIGTTITILLPNIDKGE